MVDPVLFDTNILIDALKGVSAARKLLKRCTDRAISVVTWVEVMAGTTAQTAPGTELYLDAFALVSLSAKIARQAADVRRDTRLKFPDAVILATAQVENRLLFTRNTKDFTGKSSLIRVPYKL